ncbi:LysR family transcriptional regulator [Compostimonas suwonensis]|uniref:DNA-binding transcriptional LysR family regulator n=1 Tax=Compostimonas suwonensis TaxID=1048394 RepID=A0A2M9C4J4_9MICO|nr:LysR family transcriptional regulator [Compostimonas suwonensis]PJJ65448.1 DNA-binding transcriptional LysR family regulator [Compostimonas suwonensis]
MDVRRLDLLRELSERGSVTAVARATHRTPSAVSQQLKVLEREAGVPLTERSGRGLALTHAGRELARSAADVATALERANALWDEFRNHPSGEVSLATFPTAGQMLLPGLLQRLTEVPGLVVTCSDRDPELEDFPALTSDFDVVLAHSTLGQVPWVGRGLHVTPLMREPLDVALPLGHRLAERPNVTPHDLVGETWIGVPPGYPFNRVLDEIEVVSGHPIVTSQRFGDTRVTEAFVAAGLGIALLPCFTAGGLDDRGLVLKTLSGVTAARNIVALTRPDRAERLAVRTVLDALVAESERVQRANAGRS